MALRSTRIDKFPPEVLSGITRLLSRYDICRLVFVGDGLLLATFRQGGVTEFWLRDTQEEPVAAVSYLSQLLVYSCSHKYNIYYMDREIFWLERLPKTLF